MPSSLPARPRSHINEPRLARVARKLAGCSGERVDEPQPTASGAKLTTARGVGAAAAGAVASGSSGSAPSWKAPQAERLASSGSVEAAVWLALGSVPLALVLAAAAPALVLVAASAARSAARSLRRLRANVNGRRSTMKKPPRHTRSNQFRRRLAPEPQTAGLRARPRQPFHGPADTSSHDPTAALEPKSP